MRQACSQVRIWHDRGLPIRRVAVNISSRQILRGNIVRTVQSILEETGLDAGVLELEITENVIMQQTEQVIAILESLQALGVSLAVDDFGTGYSSLAYLKRLPVNKLKIDRSFVCEIPNHSGDAAITKAILVLGRSLQIDVVAEGVETNEQFASLKSEGCTEVQGYLHGAPMPAEDFMQLLEPCKPVALVGRM